MKAEIEKWQEGDCYSMGTRGTSDVEVDSVSNISAWAEEINSKKTDTADSSLAGTDGNRKESLSVPCQGSEERVTTITAVWFRPWHPSPSKYQFPLIFP